MNDRNTATAGRWMLYGAYGYTGKLVIDEALQRGHRPVLAGRDKTKLRELAEPLGLEWCAVGLDNNAALDRALTDIDLVYHVAGPFTQTAKPMLEACLRTQTHYVDVTGESPVTCDTLRQHSRAKEAGILLLPSSGVNTVPTDAVAAYVHAQLPDATWLDVAIDTVHQRSSGSLTSMLEVATLKGQVRRKGMIMDEAIGARLRKIRFPDGEKHCIALPFADLHTAFHATKIPNITTWVAQDFFTTRAMKYSAPLLGRVFANEWLKRRVQDEIRKRVAGPDAGARNADRTYAWALARNHAGETREAWLETLEGYTFTGAIAPRIVETVLASDLTGATTVAAAFGPDFVMQLPRTYRYTELRR